MQIRHVVDLRPPPMAGFAVFSPLRFSIYAKDLDRALAGIIQESPEMRRDYHYIKPRPMMVEPPPLPQNKLNGVPIKKNLTGASFLADLIRTQQAAIKQQLSEAGTELTKAMVELQDTANEATNQVKVVKQETADLKAALGLNSNSEPS